MNQSKLPYLLITLLAALLYLPGLGLIHLFDWDEINFAEAAREMLVTGDFGRVQIGFEPFWEKPPLFHWMQAISMSIFGVNEFAARFPNFLASVFTLNLLYYVGSKHQSIFIGAAWSLVYACSLAPTLYFKTGIIDPWFNAFIFCGIYQLYLAHISKRNELNPGKHYLFSGIFIGLAVLTKGPVALLIAFLVWLLLLIRKGISLWPGIKNLALFSLTCILISGAWFIPETIKNGPWFLQSFIEYQLVLAKGQIPWHNQPFYYHFIVLFFLCFPASILALRKFGKFEESNEEKYWLTLFMKALFWVVLILFSIVRTKIIHYSSMCWIPLTYLAAHTLGANYTLKERLPKWLAIPGILATIIPGLVFTLVPIIASYTPLSQYIASQIPDAFATEALLSDGNWQGWEWLIGAIFLWIGLAWWISLISGKPAPTLVILAATLLFSQGVYYVLLPKVEEQLQGKMIRRLNQLSTQEAYVTWSGFKTYAVHYYAKQDPHKEDKALKAFLTNQNEAFGTPGKKSDLKQTYLLEQPTSKPVFVLTRIDYKADSSWNQRFTKTYQEGPYLFWKKR